MAVFNGPHPRRIHPRRTEEQIRRFKDGRKLIVGWLDSEEYYDTDDLYGRAVIGLDRYGKIWQATYDWERTEDIRVWLTLECKSSNKTVFSSKAISEEYADKLYELIRQNTPGSLSLEYLSQCLDNLIMEDEL